MHTDILFYKRIVSIGGAEVLLNEHYQYLRDNGRKPLVIAFEISELDRINISEADVVIIQRKNILLKILKLRNVIKKNTAAQIICHSGYIELGIASLSLKRDFSIFIHQPSSMSFNETDKFSIFYWRKFKRLFPNLHMFNQLVYRRKEMSLTSKIYINLRTALSQYILKRAKKIFVLSNYAQTEKKMLFNLKTSVQVGALNLKNLNKAFSLARPHKKTKSYKIVTLSRLDENKRIDVLIKALKELRDDGLDVSLDICGTGPAKQQLTQLIESLKLEPYVKLLGYINEDCVSRIYLEADLFATIDWADFRLTTYEALSYRCKVLVSDDTEIDCSLKKSGYLFASNPRVDAVFLKIKEALAADPIWSEEDLYSHLKKFTWERYFANISKEVAL